MSNIEFIQPEFQLLPIDLPSGFDGVEPALVTQADGSEPSDEFRGLR